MSMLSLVSDIWQSLVDDKKETKEGLIELRKSRESMKKNKEARKDAKMAQAKRCLALVRECGFDKKIR